MVSPKSKKNGSTSKSPGKKSKSRESDGGEFAFSFSRVAKIEAKEAPVDKRRSLSPAPSLADLNDSSHSKTMAQSASRKPFLKNASYDDDDDDDDSSEDEAPPEDNPMELIEKSPYEVGEHAEKGTKLFADLEEVLTQPDDSYQNASPRAVKAFGSMSEAIRIIKAREAIHHSGMLYSQEWIDGNLRGAGVGKIDRDIVLICLLAKRFGKAQDTLLSGILRDLQVCSLIQEALAEWKLEDEHPRMATSAAKTFPFSSKKRDTFKCCVFVGRVYSAMKLLGISTRDPEFAELRDRVMTCLEIMESRMPDPSKSKKRKSANSMTLKQDVDPSPPKKKRGRPPKVRQPPDESTKLLDAESSGADDDDEGEDYQPEEPPAAMASKPTVRQRKKPGPKPKRAISRSDPGSASVSLTLLISQFEEKYEEIGQLYSEMGDTLRAIKTAVAENQSPSEEALRAEILEEVQKAVLGRK